MVFAYAFIPILIGIVVYFLRDDFVSSYDYDISSAHVKADDANVTFAEYQKLAFYIPSGNPQKCKEALHSWLYIPARKEPSPIVVISHGLGGQKDMGLEEYALAFVRAGFNALVIDYRTFGGSRSECGKFRNHINPWAHVADIKTAVNFVVDGNLGGSVDAERLALWGTSFAGGHMVVAAAELGTKVKAVISQVPHMDGRAASKRGIALRGVVGTIKVAIVSLADYTLSLLGLPPLYVKIISSSGSDLSYMVVSQHEMDTYFAKHPKRYLGDWKNLAPARTLAFMSLYNPIQHVQDVKAPILFVSAGKDELCPAELVRAAARKAANAASRIIERDCGHFDIYLGDIGAEMRREMVQFLQGVL